MALTIKQLMDYSWMSQASYLEFNGSGSFELKLKESSINNDKKFTDTQAKLFTGSATATDPTDGFSFINHIPNVEDVGFSATVFNSNADNSYSIERSK